jgi:hypothetical protein
MSTGYRIKLSHVRVKDGKIQRVYVYRSASAAIAARKSSKSKPVRGPR